MSVKFVKYPSPKLNRFNVKWKRYWSCGLGGLYPIMCEYMMPNSRWHFKPTHKLRSLPLVAPMMHDVNIYTHYFKVPLRLLLEDPYYSSYMTGGKNDDDATPTPVVNSGVNGYAAGSLMDYLGYSSNYVDDSGNTVTVPNFTQNAWAIRAYNQIVNDWYINPNITEERVISKAPGLDTTTDQTLFYRGWMPDKFTNGMPELSRGDPVYLPLGTEAPVIGNGNALGFTDGTLEGGTYTVDPYGMVIATGNVGVTNGTASSGTVIRNSKVIGVSTDPEKSGVVTDLTDASALDVNELRDTLALGFAKNLSMYIGTHFSDWLYGTFGCRPADARLQRAEYLGGAVSPLYVDEVEQTSTSTGSATAQGNLAGKGISINGNRWIDGYADEPCIIMGLMSIMPVTSYFQGSRRWMNYNSRYDFPNPLYAKISDQAVPEKEIFAQADNASTNVTYTDENGNTVTTAVSNDTTFCFEPRFEEAKTIPSTLHGQMRTTLKYWSLVREFPSSQPPMLNDSFIYSQGVSNRVFADTDPNTDKFIVGSFFNGYIVQPLPKDNLPSSMGLLYGGF